MMQRLELSDKDSYHKIDIYNTLETSDVGKDQMSIIKLKI